MSTSVQRVGADYARRHEAKLSHGVLISGTSCHSVKESMMAAPLKPGQTTGPNGGIFREQGPRGGLRDNFTTVPDNRQMPPTSKPGSVWVPVKRTPDSSR